MNMVDHPFFSSWSFYSTGLNVTYSTQQAPCHLGSCSKFCKIVKSRGTLHSDFPRHFPTLSNIPRLCSTFPDFAQHSPTLLDIPRLYATFPDFARHSPTLGDLSRPPPTLNNLTILRNFEQLPKWHGALPIIFGPKNGPWKIFAILAGNSNFGGKIVFFNISLHFARKTVCSNE